MKHNDIIDDLERRIRNLHPESLIVKEQDYDIYGQHGEIDLGLITPNLTYLIEVKTTNSYKSRSKAYKQLFKDKRWSTKNYYSDKTHCFYAFSSGKRRGYDVIKLDVN